ncbi:MAG: hypothetical protein R6U95_06910 [Bacteroidales bacterium]
MPRLDKETKKDIQKLNDKDLRDIIIKLASKDKMVYDYLQINYLNKESGAQELFEETIADLDDISWKQYKGYSPQVRQTKMLAAYIKRINDFTKICTNKVYEADLLVYILEITFSSPPDMFGTCFTQFDTKVAIILKRLINIITKKLHEDYKIEYKDRINNYLNILHTQSNFIDTIYNLPQKI